MATILTDNFDSYNDGDLDSQGSWTATADIKVQGTTTIQGAKSIFCDMSGTGTASKTGTGQTTGTVSMLMRCDTTDATYAIRLYEGATLCVAFGFVANKIQYFTTAWTEYAASFDLEGWYIFQIYWETDPAKKVKYRAWKVGSTAGSWTSLVDPYAAWTTNLDKILMIISTDGIDCYFDYIGESSPLDFPITASTGSFALTSIETALTSARSIIAALGEFTLTGIDNILTKGWNMVASVGEFALTGVAAGITSARSMAAAVGEFTLTGIDATFNLAKVMVASVGSFILTGIDTIFTKALTMAAAVGSFVLTGVATTFEKVTKMVFSSPLIIKISKIIPKIKFYKTKPKISLSKIIPKIKIK